MSYKGTLPETGQQLDMWREYSSGYIKNNRASGWSVMIAAFISALLLSLLCGLFYNAWKYEVERIELEEGGWQSRIVGTFDTQDIQFVQNFAHVKDIIIVEKEYGETAIDVYFDDYRAVFSDTPRIADLVGASQEEIVYNYPLLAMHLIRSSQDTAPRLVFPLFLVILALASLSLIVIIHNSFAVSMNARTHQFGIFSSIGATPKQIRACLLQEAAVLCAVPVLAGNLIGIAGSMGLIQLSNLLLGSGIPGRHPAVFGYHPLVLIPTLLITVITVWISAWLPARKLSRLTPLEAIKNTEDLRLKRKKNARLLTLFFGVEGELAGLALKAQRKALRTTSLSLIFSFMAFTIMQSFFTLSDISTRETYFEKYQSVWDIMVTVKDTDVDAFAETAAIQRLGGVESAIVYQKASAGRIIPEEELSGEMAAIGGFTHASGNFVTQVDGGWLVNAPIVILDDNSFLAYCAQLGIAPRLDGAVVINQIRDVTNPDFRHPVFMPYLNSSATAENTVTVLRQTANREITAEIPVLAYAKEPPALREEYATLDFYELVHFMPASLWRQIKGQMEGAGKDTYICVRSGENATLEELCALQDAIDQIISQNYRMECENRIQEYDMNDKQIQGMKTVLGSFCALLAVIGIGNMFSNTLGFVRQRKREFARYLSVGMTPAEIRKLFCIEALALAGRPMIITLLLAVIAVGWMLRMSYLAAAEFLAEAPLVPIGLFMLAVMGSVALAYFLAWRNVRSISLAAVLRDDTMM